MTNMPPLKFCCLIIPAFLLGCAGSEPKHSPNSSILENGPYRFSLQIDAYELPFNADILSIEGENRAEIIITNANERIVVQDVILSKDSIIANLPVFNSSLLGRVESPTLISGSFVTFKKDQKTSIPFIAEKGKPFRFTSTSSSTSLHSKYRVRFNPESSDEYPAILVLENMDGKLSATFLTETGDYRFLEGNIMNNKIYLSTFDGSHAFYFEAQIDGDQLTNGVFRSGLTSLSSWDAAADSTFELTNPFELTQLIDSTKPFNISLPNQDGTILDWDALGLNGRVVIIDVFGSWCPNCKDAAVALHTLTQKYPTDDIALIPVAFELTEDLTTARKRVFKMQRDLELPEGFLFGGYASKKNATETFPMLNHIMSFPTIIVIDRDRKVRSIYTGFYGPGTGAYYDQFMSQMDALLTSLVNQR